MTPVQWLRLAYRVGAVVDAAAFVQLLVVAVFARSLVLGPLPADGAYRFAAGMAAALMLGWAALLLWADRRPAERRGVLPLTLLVVAGLALSEVWAVASGPLRAAPGVALLAMQAALAALFVVAWLRARRAQ